MKIWVEITRKGGVQFREKETVSALSSATKELLKVWGELFLTEEPVGVRAQSKASRITDS